MGWLSNLFNKVTPPKQTATGKTPSGSYTTSSKPSSSYTPTTTAPKTQDQWSSSGGKLTNYNSGGSGKVTTPSTPATSSSKQPSLGTQISNSVKDYLTPKQGAQTQSQWESSGGKLTDYNTPSSSPAPQRPLTQDRWQQSGGQLTNYNSGGSSSGSSTPKSQTPTQGSNSSGGGYQQSTPQAPQAQQFSQQQTAQSVSMIDSIMGQFQSMYADIKKSSAEQVSAIGAQFEVMLGQINQMEQQIKDQYKNQINGDDPGMLAAIGVIRDEAMRMRNQALEELNARGLAQSGIYAEMVDRLGRNELTNIQQVTSSKFGELQTQLNSALMNLAQMRISALAQNQNSLNQVNQHNQSLVANMGMQGLNMAQNMYAQQQQNQQFYDKLAQDQNQFNAQLSASNANRQAQSSQDSLSERKWGYEVMQNELQLANSDIPRFVNEIKSGVDPNRVYATIDSIYKDPTAKQYIIDQIKYMTYQAPQQTKKQSSGYLDPILQLANRTSSQS